MGCNWVAKMYTFSFAALVYFFEYTNANYFHLLNYSFPVDCCGIYNLHYITEVFNILNPFKLRSEFTFEHLLFVEVLSQGTLAFIILQHVYLNLFFSKQNKKVKNSVIYIRFNLQRS